MDEIHDPYLRAAAQAIQLGELDKARSILAALLSQDSSNVEAWFLLSAVVEQPVAIAGCLRNVLLLTPDHAGALMLREKLEQEWHLPPLQVMRIATTSAAISQLCPFCTSHIQVKDEVVTCPQCRTTHHYNCWQENGHCCAARLCHGFSFHELDGQPLPTQPTQTDVPVVVIWKEDIGNVRKMSRKEKEQGFQRHMLMLKLLAEEGQLPAQLAAALPSMDALLDQIQRDRSSVKSSPTPPTIIQPGTQPPASIPRAPIVTPTIHPNYQKTGVVKGTMSIWAPPASDDAHAQSTATSTPQQCKQCGYSFPTARPAFCPRCGSAQPGEDG